MDKDLLLPPLVVTQDIRLIRIKKMYDVKLLRATLYMIENVCIPPKLQNCRCRLVRTGKFLGVNGKNKTILRKATVKLVTLLAQ